MQFAAESSHRPEMYGCLLGEAPTTCMHERLCRPTLSTIALATACERQGSNAVSREQHVRG